MKRLATFLVFVVLASFVTLGPNDVASGNEQGQENTQQSADGEISTSTTVPADPPRPDRKVIRAAIVRLDDAVRGIAGDGGERLAIEGELADANRRLSEARDVEYPRLWERFSRQSESLQRAGDRVKRANESLSQERSRLREVSIGLYIGGKSVAELDFTSSNTTGGFRSSQTMQVGIGILRDRVAALESRVTEAVAAEEKQRAQVATSTAELAELELLQVELVGEVEDATRRLSELDVRSADLSISAPILQDDIVALLRAAGMPTNRGVDPAMTIMGESVLTADQLMAWFASERRGAAPADGPVMVGKNNVTELAALYIEEGAALGVRGDMAFVQAVLETGGFRFTGTNNFAGIGHCDACERGYPFPTAREGVRAQIQLLRGYADTNVRNADLPGGRMEGINLDTLGVRGCCVTWWGLSGVWASALHYGGSMLKMYDAAVTLAEANRAWAEQAPAT